jgi:hypothetical protein
MNAGIADRRCITLYSDATSRTYQATLSALTRRCGAARPARKVRFAILFGCAAVLALRASQVWAQDAGMLDERVTQESIGETLCRPGYADMVAPPFADLMAHKDRMLAARGIEADNGPAFALDRRVPVVLGGSPNAPANLDLLPWAGPQGERPEDSAAAAAGRPPRCCALHRRAWGGC